MSGTWGNKIKITVYGESHGKGIGAILDGVEAGMDIDFKQVQDEMERRAPGRNSMSTKRQEADEVQVLSGIFEGKTTGAPIAILIYNQDMKSKDYSKTKDLARPSHADYPAYKKYKGFNDYRGGGHFSGRLTAGLVACGAIAKQIIAKKNIYIGAHIKQIGNVYDDNFDAVTLERSVFELIKNKQLPVINDNCINLLQGVVEQAHKENDSVGGMIECGIVGISAGLGDPFFDSVESRIAQLAFSVPAVKGIEFGLGFEFAKHYGSEVNDLYTNKDGVIKTETNYNGGILGGITNGMPIVFKVPIKPTPSISKPQQTINMKTNEMEILTIKGRHDPCIVQRAVVVIEAIAALAVLDLL
ncbi:MAG: chorismate synthase [Cellulosilyticaceae bacterium]